MEHDQETIVAMTFQVYFEWSKTNECCTIWSIRHTSSSYDGGHCRSDGAAAVVCSKESWEMPKGNFERCRKETSVLIIYHCISINILIK